MPMPPSDIIPLVRDVEPLLRTDSFGRVMEGHTTLGSTNTRAAEWAAESTPEGSVVVAEHQTAGRGRYGRSWNTNAGQNLTFSVVLRPRLSAKYLGLITIAAAVGVTDALDDFAAPLRATIKWPNDVLLCARKCCGMLLETSFSEQQQRSPDFVILGVGLNVNQERFPPALSDRAISIKQAVRRPIERPPLFATLLGHLEQRYRSLFIDEGATARAAYEARLERFDRPVTLRVVDTGRAVRGIMRGISPRGALRLETKEGLRTFHAGEVTSR